MARVGFTFAVIYSKWVLVLVFLDMGLIRIGVFHEDMNCIQGEYYLVFAIFWWPPYISESLGLKLGLGR